tara:strand:+ start:276 stop:635 length:360 start_codon:yes stop_codon:yes gene_type:complete
MNNNLIKRYAILWLESQGNDIDKISEDLDIPKSSVKRIVKLYADQSKKETTEPSKTAEAVQDKRKTAKDFMINETAGKGSSGVTIMTKTASEISDASKKNNTNNQSKLSNCIYKLDENK